MRLAKVKREHLFGKGCSAVIEGPSASESSECDGGLLGFGFFVPDEVRELVQALFFSLFVVSHDA